MADIFISYSRKNADFMRQLHAALAQTGRETWVDWEGIPYSVDWWQEICRGIDAAVSFLFIVSPDSLTSPVCQQELEYARRNHKRIVPIIRHDPEIKVLAGEWFGQEWEATARANWLELQKINWLFFRPTDDFDTAFANLVHTLGEDPAYVREHTRLLLRAREWENNGHKPSFFLRGDELVEAGLWLKSAKTPAPTPLQVEYIEASLTYERAETHRQKTRDRHLLEARLGLVLAIVLVAFLAVVFSAVQSQSERESAVENQRLADNANAKAATAISAQETSAANLLTAQTNLALLWSDLAQQQLAQNKPQLALNLALSAINSRDDGFANIRPESRQALYDALQPLQYQHAFHQFPAMIQGVQWSSDNAYLAVWTSEQLFIWEIATDEITSYPINNIHRFLWNNPHDHFAVLTTQRLGFYAVGNPEPLWEFPFTEFAIGEIYWSAERTSLIGLTSAGAFLFDIATGSINNSVKTRDSIDFRLSEWRISPDHRYLAYWLPDAFDSAVAVDLAIYDTATLALIQTLPHEKGLKGMVWSEDNQAIWTYSGHTALRWQIAQNDPPTEYLMTGNIGGLAANSKYLVMWNESFTRLHAYALTGTGSGSTSPSKEYKPAEMTAFWSPNHDKLLFVSPATSLCVWDIASLLEDAEAEICLAANDVLQGVWLENSDLVLGVSRGKLILWNPISLWNVTEIGFNDLVVPFSSTGTAWSEDTTRIATWTSNGNWMQIWDLSPIPSRASIPVDPYSYTCSLITPTESAIPSDSPLSEFLSDQSGCYTPQTTSQPYFYTWKQEEGWDMLRQWDRETGSKNAEWRADKFGFWLTEAHVVIYDDTEDMLQVSDASNHDLVRLLPNISTNTEVQNVYIEDGNLIIQTEAQFKVYDLLTGTQIWASEFSPYLYSSLNADKRYVVLISRNPVDTAQVALEIREVHTGALVHRVSWENFTQDGSWSWNKQGTQFLYADQQAAVIFTVGETATRRISNLEIDEPLVYLTWSPSGKQIWFATTQEMGIYQNGNVIFRIGHQPAIVQWNSDETRLALTYESNTTIWDIATQELYLTLMDFAGWGDSPATIIISNRVGQNMIWNIDRDHLLALAQTKLIPGFMSPEMRQQFYLPVEEQP